MRTNVRVDSVKSPTQKHIFTIVLALIVILDIALFVRASYLDRKNSVVDTSKQVVSKMPTPTPIKKWHLVNTRTQERINLGFDKGDRGSLPTRNNKIYYINNSSNLVSYDLVTAKEEIVFLSEEAQKLILSKKLVYEGEKGTFSVQGIIANSLYVTFSTYSSGTLFSLNLDDNTPSLKEVLVDDGKHPTLEFYSNKYWIISSAGDACYGASNYYTFDPTTGKSILVFKEKAYENKFIGIDRENQLLYAKMKVNPALESTTCPRDVAYFIGSIDAGNPLNQREIIPSDKIPENTEGFVYDNVNDILYLKGRNNSKYEFKSGLMTKVYITDIPAKGQRPSSWSYGLSDETIKNIHLPSGYKFVLE